MAASSGRASRVGASVRLQQGKVSDVNDPWELQACRNA